VPVVDGDDLARVPVVCGDCGRTYCVLTGDPDGERMPLCVMCRDRLLLIRAERSRITR
jgi:hypothetical protein